MLWDELCEFCEERGYDLANALAIALGDQRDYETQPTFDLSGKQRLDIYLQKEIRKCLENWMEEEQQKSTGLQDDEDEIAASGDDGTEIITIELPSELQRQDEGF